MALTPTTIKNSFIQINPPVNDGACVIPQICLPVVNPTDLAFQLTFIATGTDFNYMMQITPDVGNAEFQGSISGATLTISNMVTGHMSIGQLITGGGVAPNTVITAYGTGDGQAGTYTVNNPQTATGGYMFGSSGILGRIGAVIVPEGDTPASALPESAPDYICTAAAPTANANEWVLYFQPTSVTPSLYWLEIPVGTCFSLYFYEIAYVFGGGGSTGGSGAWNYQTSNLTAYNTYTCFTKVADDCDGYPTSVLQYANNSDAFGFYYDGLIELVDNINFLNSVRLPVYLHSPEQAEDQVSYAKSDGSTLKLSHRIWTDYKLKTDYLTADMHRALVAATAHDLVFITCGLTGLNPWLDDNGNATPYSFTNTQTQLVRTEKIEIEWQQENMPRFKLGQAKGTLRLAEASANANTNCT